MSGLLIGRVHLVTFLILNPVVVYYATATEATQPHKQRQNYNDAEINSGKTTNGKLWKGKEAKTAPARRLTESQVNSGFNKDYKVSAATTSQRAEIQGRQRNQTNRETVAEISKTDSADLSSIPRRYESQKEPPSQLQLNTHFQIPRVNRQRAGSHKGQQRSRNHSPQRSESERPLPSEINAYRRIVKGRIIGSNQKGNLSASERLPSKNASRPRMTSITTTTQATTTPHNDYFENISQKMPFSFLPTYFWRLSQPPTVIASSRKRPKKFKPTKPASSGNFEKSHYAETSQKMASDTANNSSDDGPLRIALPTTNILNSSTKNTDQNVEKEKGKRDTVQSLRERFDCPRESEVRFQLFPKICKVDNDCNVWNRDELCCEIFGAKSCAVGVSKPLEETSHKPILGLIPRKCPTRPLAELWWDVTECNTDNDCWPRVCCPDGHRRYCRTSAPELEVVSTPFKRSFNYLTEYLECTPPPPTIFDLHPKACISTLDCFPNVCCQEAGLRHCRPPKKSVLTLMANFLNVGFVKKLTQNLVIK